MSIEIRAELIGTVIGVGTRKGSRVVENDTIVLLESMKMEIPVLAECRGTVERVAVEEGDVVGSGDLVAVIATPV